VDRPVAGEPGERARDLAAPGELGVARDRRSARVSPRLEAVACALCGGGETRPWLAARDVEFGGEEAFTIVQCRGCGLRFLNPRPAPADIGRYYPPAYYTHAALDEGREARVYATALRLVGAFGRPGPLLDVGAGDGAFMSLLRRRGWPAVEGIEADEDAWRVAALQRGLTVARGMFPAAAPPGGPYRTVTMLETIEHLHDPLAGLGAAARLLEPGGRLILTTPNVEGLEFRLLGARSISLQVPRHLYFFSAGTLSRACARAGLRVVALRTSGATDGITRSAWLAVRHGMARNGREGSGAGGAGPGAPRCDPSIADAPAAVGDRAGGVPTADSWRRRWHERLERALSPFGWGLARLGLGPTLLLVAERPG